jgi:hypothetical protein
MNERLQNLAEQARSWAETAYKQQNDQFTSHWDNPVGYTVTQFFEQKFAELIVRECARSVTWYTKEERNWPNNGQVIRANKTVLEHFGVEE